jgi:uncharacterized lipoprotein YajG
VKKSALIFLAFSILLLAACQKTPEPVMDGNVMRAKSTNDLLVESLVSAPADNSNQGGTTVGYKKICRLMRVIRNCTELRIHIDECRKEPHIAGIRVY